MNPTLSKSRSRLFRPKKMRSLNKLFTNMTTTAATNESSISATDNRSAPAIVVSPNSSGSSPDTPSPSSIIFAPTSATIRQYPPKPLVYSDDISPPPENVIKTRKSCTLKHHTTDLHDKHPHRRSSAPTFMPPHTSKNRVFSFLRSTLR